MQNIFQKVIFVSGVSVISFFSSNIANAANATSALISLEKGNQLFSSGKSIKYDQLAELKKKIASQKPDAVILSCMDSRVPPEIVFNQKIGSMFAIRNAGNVENLDSLASLEYATKAVGTPLILVMGHTSCGAMQAACEKVKMGNITNLTANLQIPVKMAEHIHHNKNCKDPKLIDEIAKQNVYYQITICRKPKTRS